MDPITIGMLAMGALNMIQGQQKEKRQTELAAATQRYSPWTKLQAQPIDYANPVGDAAQAGGSALGYEQNKKAAASRDALLQAQIGALNRGGYQSRGPWSSMGDNLPSNTGYGSMAGIG